jgi:hypothetical protein
MRTLFWLKNNRPIRLVIRKRLRALNRYIYRFLTFYVNAALIFMLYVLGELRQSDRDCDA